MGVVSIGGLVFDVSCRDCDTSLSLFGSFIDGAICEEFGEALLCLSFRYGGC